MPQATDGFFKIVGVLAVLAGACWLIWHYAINKKTPPASGTGGGGTGGTKPQ